MSPNDSIAAVNKGNVHLGLTLPLSIYNGSRSLYLSALELFFPLDLSFNDFLCLLLERSLHRSIHEVPRDRSGFREKTFFIHLRIPSEIKSRANAATGGIPVDLNELIRLILADGTTEDGSLQVMIDVLSCKDAIGKIRTRRAPVLQLIRGGLFSNCFESKTHNVNEEVTQAHLRHLGRLVDIREGSK